MAEDTTCQATALPQTKFAVALSAALSRPAEPFPWEKAADDAIAWLDERIGGDSDGTC